MLDLNDDIEWVFSMDESVSDNYIHKTSEAAVTIGGTGYAFRGAGLKFMDFRAAVRPTGGVVSMIHNLEVLGVITDDTAKTTRSIVRTMGLIYGWMGLMDAVRGILQAKRAIDSALAAGESIAYAAAQQWHALAMAGLAAGAVTVGLKIGEGDWNFPGYEGGAKQRKKTVEDALQRYRNDQLYNGDMAARLGDFPKAEMYYRRAGLSADEIRRRLKLYRGV